MESERIEVVVGTYEEFILGYKLVTDKEVNFRLVQSFANHSHRASIRCVATVGKYLASGGADEDIHLYDLSTRRESGVLGYHNGTVNCLEFTPNTSHLLSGCEKGVIAVCRMGNWQVEKLWGAAHKGSAVTSLSVHPTGKLALSVGRDGRLRTWNLVKGRQAYATNLTLDKYKQVTSVKWSPSGDLYAVVLLFRVDVYNMETAGVMYSIDSTKKISCICFLSNEVLCVGDEEGMLSLHSLPQCCLLKEVKAHEQRVKCMDRVNLWLISASSSGIIKLWSLKGEECLEEVCSVSTGCRITCAVLVHGQFCTVPIKDEVTEIEPPVKSVKRRTGIVVELSDSESTPNKEKKSRKTSGEKKNKKKKLMKLGNKLVHPNSSTVLDSSGQKWIVEDIK